MPMYMTLDPEEWIMIGESRIMNIHPTMAKFEIDGSAPVLRQANTMLEEDADTPIKRTYLAVQRLYLGYTKDLSEYHREVSELIKSDTEMKMLILKANGQIASGALYSALRTYRTHIEKSAKREHHESAMTAAG
jgi:flagellar biosynthesis regulator FlbT